MNPTTGITHVRRRQTTSVTATTSAAPAWEAAHEGQALRTVPLSATRSGGPLRSHGRASRVREMRQPTEGGHQSVPTQGPQEATMHNGPQHLFNGAAKRCAICD